MSSSSPQHAPRKSAIVRHGRVSGSPFAPLGHRSDAHPIVGRLSADDDSPAFVPLVGPRKAADEVSAAAASEARRARAAEEAETLLRDARRQAGEIIVGAHEQAEAIRETAFREGRESGLRAGREAAEAEIGESARALAALAEAARVECRGLLLAAERRVVDLSLAIARKVLDRELQTDETAILDVVRAALHEIDDVIAARVRVRVNPAYETTISTYWSGEVPNVEFVGDSGLALGDCLIDSDACGLDARVETRLAEIAAALDATFAARLNAPLGAASDAGDYAGEDGQVDAATDAAPAEAASRP